MRPLRLITEVSPRAREREVRHDFEVRAHEFLRGALLERGRERQREARRKKLVFVAFWLGMGVLLFCIGAPYSLLSRVAMRLAQTATVFASLLIVGLVLKTTGDALRTVRRPTGSTAGTEVPREK